MGKKRKTKQEKIILQLKRELTRREQRTASETTKPRPRQEAILKRPQAIPPQSYVRKNTDNPILSYNPRLIKKDLVKTLLLAIIILCFELVLYWRLR